MFHKSQLKLLFEYVIFVTKDPKVFFNIALVCKDFAELCRQYTPMKKNDFKIEREYYDALQKQKGYFLPNGYRHEIKNYIYDDYNYKTEVYNTGRCKKMIYCTCGDDEECLCDVDVMPRYSDIPTFITPGNSFMLLNGTYFGLQLYINKDVKIGITNKKYSARILFKFCSLCKKSHNIDIYHSRRDIKSFMSKIDCLTGKIYVGNYLTPEFFDAERKIERRNRIIKSVIEYSKSLYRLEN